MRALWGGLSLLFFFAAIGLFVWMLFAREGTLLGTLLGDVDGVFLAIAGFVVLLLSYFARRIARRYP